MKRSCESPTTHQITDDRVLVFENRAFYDRVLPSNNFVKDEFMGLQKELCFEGPNFLSSSFTNALLGTNSICTYGVPKSQGSYKQSVNDAHNIPNEELNL
jgi:hypothetical protein